MTGILSPQDLHAVDHRLRLYLDMDIFEENVEEFQCFLKVRRSTPVLLSALPAPVWSAGVGGVCRSPRGAGGERECLGHPNSWGQGAGMWV